MSLAYIDPASGTLILQAVLAGLIGGAAIFRRSIAAAVLWVFRGRNTSSNADQDGADVEGD